MTKVAQGTEISFRLATDTPQNIFTESLDVLREVGSVEASFQFAARHLVEKKSAEVRVAVATHTRHSTIIQAIGRALSSGLVPNYVPGLEQTNGFSSESLRYLRITRPDSAASYVDRAHFRYLGNLLGYKSSFSTTLFNALVFPLEREEKNKPGIIVPPESLGLKTVRREVTDLPSLPKSETIAKSSPRSNGERIYGNAGYYGPDRVRAHDIVIQVDSLIGASEDTGGLAALYGITDNNVTLLRTMGVFLGHEIEESPFLLHQPLDDGHVQL